MCLKARLTRFQVFPRSDRRVGTHPNSVKIQKHLWACGILLETDADLDFLFRLSKSELETLVAVLRNRLENFGES